MKNIFFFGSCRIHEPLKLINNIFLSERKGIQNVYNTSQLLQYISFNNKDISNIDKSILNNFFPYNNFDYGINDLFKQKNAIFSSDIDFYIIEISSLKNIVFDNISLGTSIESELKYLFGIDFNDFKKLTTPRKLQFNINNILLMSKNKTILTGNTIIYNLKNIKKNIIRENIDKKYTDSIEYFKDKVSSDFFVYLSRLVYIISNAEYKEQNKQDLFLNLNAICNILKKPIIFVPIFNAVGKNKKPLENRIQITEYLKEYTKQNNMLFFDSNIITNKYNYDEIFEKYSSDQKWEIERFGIYDVNHLNKIGVKKMSEELSIFLENIK